VRAKQWKDEAVRIQRYGGRSQEMSQSGHVRSKIVLKTQTQAWERS